MPAFPGVADHALFALLAVGFPLRSAFFGFRRLQSAAEEDVPRVKLAVYRQAMAMQWALAAAVAGLWLWAGRPWAAIGLQWWPTPGLGGVLAGAALIVALMARLGQLRAPGDEELERLRRRLGRLERLLPATQRERGWFFALALTAGVCEELLYRGFVIRYLLTWLGFAPAAALAAVLFGLGHAYQGVRGVLLTALVGGFMAGVYWLTRSIFACMLLHALMDLHAGQVSYLAFSRRPAAPGEPVA